MPVFRQIDEGKVEIIARGRLCSVINSMIFFANEEVKKLGGCSLLLQNGEMLIDKWGIDKTENACIFISTVDVKGNLASRQNVSKQVLKGIVAMEESNEIQYPMIVHRAAYVKPWYTKTEIKEKIAAIREAEKAKKIAKEQQSGSGKKGRKKAVVLE